MSKVEQFAEQLIRDVQAAAKRKGFSVVILERERPAENVIEFKVEVSGERKRSR